MAPGRVYGATVFSEQPARFLIVERLVSCADPRVDLLTKAGGIDYAEAARDADVRDIDGVQIPFASPRLLWRMKRVTHREKDAGDLVFLR